MATITVEEVREIINTDLPDYIIQAFIDQMDGADDCLDALGITDDQICAAKMLGVLHIITLMQRGGVSAETTKTGASRNYFDADSINSTQYGKALQTASGGQCILDQMGSDSRVYMMSIKTNRGNC
jgi:hypothetical protein